MATIVDVARTAGVVPSVVSRLLNNDPTLRIRPETEARIREAVRELGYRPNYAGRALRMARAGAIGLIVPNVTNPIYAEVLRGVQRRATEAGYFVLIGDADELGERESTYKRLVGEARIDGVLLMRNDVIDDGSLSRLLDGTVPAVLVNSKVDGHRGSVIVHDAAGVSTALRHLIELGHTRIAHLAGLPTVDWARRRRQSFQTILREAGVGVRGDWILEAGREEARGYQQTRSLLSHRDRPTAIFTATINPAIGALAAARDLGVAVPRDLSIITFHDATMARHTGPPLTAVRMPLFELGATATEVLIDRIAGAEPVDIVIEEPAPVLLQRGSCGPPPP